MSNNKQQQGKYPLHDIVTPHDHDVLSGRGNFVNYHAGNEHFRALVRKHKVAYVACPKPQKGKFSRLIVDEIKNRNPPGRFLKQDPETKLWHDIGEKKALDKTRQALREGAPEISKELGGDGGDESPLGGMPHSVLKVRTAIFFAHARAHRVCTGICCRPFDTTAFSKKHPLLTAPFFCFKPCHDNPLLYTDRVLAMQVCMD